MSAARRVVPKVAKPKQIPASKRAAPGASAAQANASLILHLQNTLQEVVRELGAVERRRVLASDGWFHGGKLFTLVSRQARIVVRLPDEAAQNELLGHAGAREWRIGKKAPMRSWIELPELWHEDPVAIGVWVKRARALAKAAKGPRKKKGSTR